METAILIDGAFLRKKFKRVFSQTIKAADVEQFVKCILQNLSFEQKDYRAYFYDCRPCDGETTPPVSHAKYFFEKQPQFKEGNQLLDEISNLDFFAVREGTLQFSGWLLRKKSYQKKSPYEDSDYSPNLSQKGVDIKIGLDIAWISYAKTFEKLILVSADSDFVPAIKVARRNGIPVYLFTLAHGVNSKLVKNADIVKKESIKDLFQNENTSRGVLSCL